MTPSESPIPEHAVDQPLQPGEIDIAQDVPYWLAFRHAKHVGPMRFQRLLERFGTLQVAWNAGSASLRGVLDERALASVLEMRGSMDPHAELERVREMGVEPLILVDPAYPVLLREVPSPPPVLYVRGSLIPEDRDAVAMVGTRRATAYGKEVATEIAEGLALAGVTVVSGLARGIDAIAHQGAINAGGRTIAVLGSGPDIIYPPEHRAMATAIAANGAVLSDYPPGTKPDAGNFPARNRIISGLSRGVVIVEAPLKSGALITADFAASQGRDVMVVPGSVLSEASEATNALLRDGARPVRNAADILEDLGIGQDAEVRVRQQAMIFDESERRIMAILTREPQHIDDVCALVGMPVAEVSGLLTMLELKGAVRHSGALHYARIG